MKKDLKRYIEIMEKKPQGGFNRYYLFSRKFEGETYEFYLNRDKAWHNGDDMSWYEAYRSDGEIICFRNGKSYAYYGYVPTWIENACKNALLKRGFRDGGLSIGSNYTAGYEGINCKEDYEECKKALGL